MSNDIEERKKDFSKWFGQTIELLSKQDYAGIPLLMIAFPLYERYTAAIKKNKFESFADDFQINTKREAMIVWKAFRHGLLHAASFKTEVKLDDGSIEKIQNCGIKDDLQVTVSIKQAPSLWWEIFISPTKFAKKTIELVLKNFDAFYQKSEENPPLSQEYYTPSDLGYSGYSGHCDSPAD